MTWLLDTNTLVYILNGEPRVRARANEAGRAGRVVTSLGAAAHFGRLKAGLRSKGVSKTDLDLLIAATALDLGATLVTNDHALLDGTIPGLAVENWV